MLVLMADRMAMSVGDLFRSSFSRINSTSLHYLHHFVWTCKIGKAPAATQEQFSPTDLYNLFRSILPPLFLIVAVLGSIFFGIATPTEAAE